MRRIIALAGIVLLLGVVLGVVLGMAPAGQARAAVPANLTPTPEPALLSAAAYCVAGVPTFNLRNDGGPMLEPRAWYLLHLGGDAASCASDISQAIVNGQFQLGSGQALTVTFPNYASYGPPYRICAQQAGILLAYLSAAIADAEDCVTAIDVTPEPGRAWHLFAPWVRR